MMNEKSNSYLMRLEGQKIVNVTTDLELLIPLKVVKSDITEEKMSVYTQVYFDEYRLDIYNKAELVCGDGDLRNIKDLIGSKVLSANENENLAQLIFDNGCLYKVDLRVEAYNGPEAMVLNGPDDLIVVWN